MELILIELIASICFVFAFLAAIKETMNGGKNNILYGAVAAVSLTVLALFAGGVQWL